MYKLRAVLVVLFIVLATPSLANAQEGSSAKDDDPPAAQEERARIDLNEATYEELLTLPGIGPSKARAILAYRERRRFHHPYAITRIKGIGRSTYARLRPLITVTAPKKR